MPKGSRTKFRWEVDHAAQRAGAKGGRAKRRTWKQMIRDKGIWYFAYLWEEPDLEKDQKRS